MSSLTISAIVFACVFGGALVGMFLRTRLPEEHLSPESKDVVKLGMGLIGTMTALVLGLLVASAKSSFDAQRQGVALMAANLIALDRALAHYGPEAQKARTLLAQSAEDMIRRTWPEDGGRFERTEGRYEELYDQLVGLKPIDDAQRTFQAQALKIATDTGQARWLLFTQRTSSVPTPFLVVMVCWLVIIFASFGLFSPRNITAFVSLFVCALAVASALFLILELDRPFEGMIRISSAPMLAAREQLGK
jgi:hypothetical protein